MTVSLKDGSEADLKLFRGDGFSLRIPITWVDLSAYTLSGPIADGFQHKVWVTADEDCKAPDSARFADDRIRGILEGSQGWRLLLRQDVELAEGLEAVRADFRWCPSKDQRAYRRYLFHAGSGAGFELSTQMTKKTKAMVGPILDEMMMSFRPMDPGHDRTEASEEGCTFEANRFRFHHDGSWVNETNYILAEPEQGGFRRNLVVMGERLDEAPPDFPEFARQRREGLAEVTEGFELVAESEAEVLGSAGAQALSFNCSTAGGGQLRQEAVLALSGADLFLVVLSTEPPGSGEEVAPFAEIPKTLVLEALDG